MTLHLFSRLHRKESPAEDAVHWLLRHDMGDLSRQEQEAFSLWLQQGDNAAAYARVLDRWRRLEDARDSDLAATVRRGAMRLRPEAPSRRLLAGAGACAAVLLVAIVALANPQIWTGLLQQPDPGKIGAADYETETGGRTVVTLPDGTRVTLNTDTALDVAYSEDQRLVRLLHGQAFFDVAKNAEWPFVVQAADRRVVALGTSFDVRLSQERFQVVLVEGSVRVDRANSTSFLSPAAPPAPQTAQPAEAAAAERILAPGEQLLAELGVPESVQVVNVERELRWRDGFIEFDDEPLSAAIAEMNRYTKRPVVIRDAGVGELRISGVFRTNQVDRFLGTISEILPVTVDYTASDHLQLRWSRDAARG